MVPSETTKVDPDLGYYYEFPITDIQRGQIHYKHLEMYNFWRNPVDPMSGIQSGKIVLNRCSITIECDFEVPDSFETIELALQWLTTEISRKKEILDALITPTLVAHAIQ